MLSHCHIAPLRRVNAVKVGDHPSPDDPKGLFMTTDTASTDTTNTAADQARMVNPMFLVDGAFQAVSALGRAIAATDLDPRWSDLINIRASQLNRCGVCLVQHHREAREHDMPDEQIFSIAGWQDAPWFTGAERAVLALTEAVTVLDPHVDAVSDALWQDITLQLNERQISAVLLQIAMINVWNRVNRATRQVAGQRW